MAPRSRLRILALIPLVVVAGLLGRKLPAFAGDFAGALLYAVLIYLVLALFAPKASAVALAFWTGAVGILIEVLQATGLPAFLADRWEPSRYLLGSTFVPLDLVLALLGAGLATMTDRLTRTTRRNHTY